MRGRRNMHYNVNPRYSGGSPASVPEHIAITVAQQELDGYKHATEGAYGEEQQQRAKNLGLRGIVELVEETAKGWKVLDLLEEKMYFRPFKAKCPSCQGLVAVRAGYFEAHHPKADRYGVNCIKSGERAETEMTDEWNGRIEGEIERAMRRVKSDSRTDDAIDFMARRRVRQLSPE